MILDEQNSVSLDVITDLSSVFPFFNLPESPSQLKETTVVLGNPARAGGSAAGAITQPGNTAPAVTTTGPGGVPISLEGLDQLLDESGGAGQGGTTFGG